ncbi:hypothetical protein GMRT_14192 [Giardia muris]|uniref:Uncharacterized protein n=1 Tax=Giardia muris TaxID=5742 RepID=A0A4Z1TCF9_GIAMU|nr:hypothetical protein GMRT_14192 [Giardia muris]|eukprot:TNJ30269.1 hypothetical protein GMRT_14192 [Giardia muris]
MPAERLFTLGLKLDCMYPYGPLFPERRLCAISALGDIAFCGNVIHIIGAGSRIVDLQLDYPPVSMRYTYQLRNECLIDRGVWVTETGYVPQHLFWFPLCSKPFRAFAPLFGTITYTGDVWIHSLSSSGVLSFVIPAETIFKGLPGISSIWHVLPLPNGSGLVIVCQGALLRVIFDLPALKQAYCSQEPSTKWIEVLTTGYVLPKELYEISTHQCSTLSRYASAASYLPNIDAVVISTNKDVVLIPMTELGRSIELLQCVGNVARLSSFTSDILTYLCIYTADSYLYYLVLCGETIRTQLTLRLQGSWDPLSQMQNIFTLDRRLQMAIPPGLHASLPILEGYDLTLPLSRPLNLQASDGVLEIPCEFVGTPIRLVELIICSPEMVLGLTHESTLLLFQVNEKEGCGMSCSATRLVCAHLTEDAISELIPPILPETFESLSLYHKGIFPVGVIFSLMVPPSISILYCARAGTGISYLRLLRSETYVLPLSLPYMRNFFEGDVHNRFTYVHNLPCDEMQALLESSHFQLSATSLLSETSPFTYALLRGMKKLQTEQFARFLEGIKLNNSVSDYSSTCALSGVKVEDLDQPFCETCEKIVSLEVLQALSPEQFKIIDKACMLSAWLCPICGRTLAYL